MFNLPEATDNISCFRGHADFLRKVPLASRLGDYSYEVWDTKLASHVKPYFLVQLCCYAEMLEQAQGLRPREIAVVSGDNKTHRFKTDDYYFYYSHIRDEFLRFHQRFDLNSMADPADSREFGRWSKFAGDVLQARDHLSLTANITHAQIKKLEARGILTCADLMQTDLDTIPRIGDETFSRLKIQARLQIESRHLPRPLYRVIDNTQQRIGLGMLPAHSDQDVFFDIEGFPVIDGGLEYLWGATLFNEDGQRDFIDFWAHDRNQEKTAFMNFVHWVYKRWRNNQDLHIYHYGHYEITACRKLMGRYGVCEYEVDQLLKNEVFVDLYKIVRHGLYVGEPGYSLKNVEHLYRQSRDTEVGAGGDSVVVYEAWRSAQDGDDWRTSQTLNNIRDYNIDDCNSTQELTFWLRQRQQENGIEYIANEPEPAPAQEEQTERVMLRDRLLALSENEKKNHPEKSALSRHMAWTLEYHRREAKPFFWRLFDRMDTSHEELLDDQDCLACCPLCQDTFPLCQDTFRL
ncbi:MAG: TM0106 family RecB-like putative nuclease [gamma proteobacterium symbiont of Bathyaustriella thionipta]|nr:TM0106 family RecB-like putative nuclease [gamma proteobacterium symbiont of Bathyaustriella thionipta]